MHREKSCRKRGDMLAEDDAGPAEPVDQAVVDHGLGTRPDLLGGLKHHHQRSGPGLAVLCQRLARSDQAGHVHVVPAGVHHWDLVTVGVHAMGAAGVGQPGLLGYRQAVHVGSEQGGRALAIAQGPDDPGSAYAGGCLVSKLAQMVSHDRRRPDLLEGQLRMGMQVLVEPGKITGGRRI
jgi:hypothetical protein